MNPISCSGEYNGLRLGHHQPNYFPLQFSSRNVRNASSPLHIDSSTHTDDITHLQFLSPSSASFHLGSPPAATHDIPSSLLLSTSYDGLVSLTDADVGRSDAALYSSAALDGGIKKAGWYWAAVGKGKQRRKQIKIWATRFG